MNIKREGRVTPIRLDRPPASGNDELAGFSLPGVQNDTAPHTIRVFEILTIPASRFRIRRLRTLRESTYGKPHAPMVIG